MRLWAGVMSCVLALLGAGVVSGCHREPTDPADRAKEFFGSGHGVSPTGLTLPRAQIFVAVPDPIPNDYDGFEAVLIPEEGRPLTGEPALRWARAHGIDDAELLARIAALFVGRSQQVAHVSNRTTDVIRGHEFIDDPRIADGRLVFFAVRGSMAPEAVQMTVDLATLAVTERAASSLAQTP